MKKIIVLGLVVLLLMSSIAAAGIWDSLTGKATADTASAAISAKPGFFARLVNWVKPAPKLIETSESVESSEPVTVSGGYTFKQGQSKSLCDRNVKLINVGSSSVTVNVDGVSENIAISGKTNFNGVLIKVDSIANSELSAVLIATCTGEGTTAPKLIETPESVESSEPVTVSSGYTLTSGQKVSLCGRNIRLVTVGSSSATVDVEGTIEEIAVGGKTSFNGVLINVDSVNDKSSAVLIFTCTGEGTTAPRLIETPESVESSEPVTVSGGYAVPGGKLKCSEVFLPMDFFSGITETELSTGVGFIRNSGKSGETFCTEKGYSTCIFINKRNDRNFYASSNGNCKGLDFADMYFRSTNCAEPLQRVQSYCQTGTYLLLEDARKDIKDWHSDESVFCCK